MKQKKILAAILALVLAILACNGEDGPRLSGTATYQPSTPVTKIEAKEAIQVYAGDVLGLAIDNLLAGGTSGELNLPVTTQEGVELAIELAGTTYFGIWKGGIASLSFGDSEVSGDWVADVRDGTLGVFAVTQAVAPPGDSAAALALIQATYPALSAYQWSEVPLGQGFGFVAAEAESVSVQSWSVTLTGSTIRAGVSPGAQADRSLVWVVVASGVLAAPLQP